MTIEPIYLRRGPAAAWTSANTVLAQGEPGFETDTGKMKIGDGVTGWASLHYIADPTAVTAAAGAVEKANNLSDLASAATARTNLGLSVTATEAVGTTAGTLAAGNDSRFAGSPAGTAGAALAATDPSTGNARTPTPHGATHETGGADVIRLDQLALPTVPLAVNNQKITGLANGTAPTDAAAVGQIAPTLAVIAFSATPAFDASTGPTHLITLTGNVTSSTVTNLASGAIVTIAWRQDATGGRTYVWPPVCKFAGGAAPAASTTAGWTDSVTFVYDGTNLIEQSRAVGVH